MKLFITIKFSFIFLVLTIFTWWIFEYSGINIPEYIPHTPIKIYGLFLGTYLITLSIIQQKAILKLDNSITMGKLMLWGTLMVFATQAVFQVILATTFTDDRVYRYFHRLIVMSAIGAFLSFFIAFQLKTKRTGLTIGIYIGLAVLIALIQQFFPNFLKP